MCRIAHSIDAANEREEGTQTASYSTSLRPADCVHIANTFIAAFSNSKFNQDYDTTQLAERYNNFSEEKEIKEL